MSCLGNILWIILCGTILFLCWGIVGILWCITIVGIPVGVQCFKFASLMLAPFGRHIEYGGGMGSSLMNILWIVFGGIEIAIVSAGIGLVLCATVIGIPFGVQCFKFAQLALMPFGARIVHN